MEIGVLGFIGCGAMAESIITGIINSNTCSPESAYFFRNDKTKLSKFCSELEKRNKKKNIKIQQASSNHEIVQKSDIVIIAVKPHQVKNVLEQVKNDFVEKKPLIIPICAGVTISFFQRYLSTNARIIRVMPNVNCLISQSASTFCMSQGAIEGKDDVATIQIFSSVGTISPVKEELMDAVTGLSGSGPAYCFQFIEALADGGVLSGLPRDTAMQLAVQTVLGSAMMVQSELSKPNGHHPAHLKDLVTSAGGTTIHGLHELEKGKLRGTVMNAVKAATERSEHLGKK